MGGQRNLVIIGAAVLLGLFAVFLANSYFDGVEEQQAQTAAAQKLARIVVASQPLAFGSKLTPENLTLANFPAASVPQGAFTSIPAALANNRVALRPIVPGEPVLASKVSGADGRATLAANLQPGMRAVTIPISNVTGVAGFALPGLTVDVLLTRQIPGEGAEQQDQMSDVIMQNVQILAIDQLADETTGEPKVGGTATLETDVYGAQKLAIAQKVGTLSLALRNVAPEQPGALTTVTVRDLPGGAMYKRGRPQVAQANPVDGLARVFSSIMPRPTTVQASAPAVVRAINPNMSIYRGAEKTDYEVGRLGGR